MLKKLYDFQVLLLIFHFGLVSWIDNGNIFCWLETSTICLRKRLPFSFCRASWISCSCCFGVRSSKNKVYLSSTVLFATIECLYMREALNWFSQTLCFFLLLHCCVCMYCSLFTMCVSVLRNFPNGLGNEVNF